MQDLFRLVRQLRQPETDDPLPGDVAELLGEYDPPLSPDEERLIYGTEQTTDDRRQTTDHRPRTTDHGRRTTDDTRYAMCDTRYAMCDTR